MKKQKEILSKQKANGIKPDVTKSLFLAGCWIDLQPLINGNTLVWYYEDDAIKTMII